MKETRTCIAIRVLILFATLTLSGCIMEEDNRNQTVEYIPKEYDADFPNNPFKGFVAWGESPDLEAYTQPWSMLYARMFWRQIEPLKGKFEWEEYEHEWNFEKAKGNKKIVLRVVLDSPSDHIEGTKMEIPDWLFEQMGHKGTEYDNPDIGNGFSPDYSNPVLIAEHKRFIAALGERYDRDPRVAFIEIGSLGHWGEWHTWPSGTGDFPRYGIAEKYVRHYVAAFPSKLILVRRPLVINANLAELGLFNDSLGENADWGTPVWLSWIEHGYTSEWDRVAHPPMSGTWWYAACSGGEFASNPEGSKHWLDGRQFNLTLQQIRDCHTSWIGPSGPGNIEGSWVYQAQINDLIKTLGYRYVIEKASYFSSALPGDTFHLSLIVANKGVAPIYYRWPLEISFITPLREIVYKTIVRDVDIRSWVPGENTAEIAVSLPRDLKPLRYVVAIAIVNPDTGTPGIDFAIDQSLRLEDGRYMLGSLFIGSGK